jgi:hypothetical protein
MWSPNTSDPHWFAYPGTPPLQCPTTLFNDGSYGKFDPSRVPQVIGSSRVHLAFITRYTALCNNDERQPITKHWIQTTGQNGRLNPDFVHKMWTLFRNLMEKAKKLWDKAPQAWQQRRHYKTFDDFPKDALLYPNTTLDDVWLHYSNAQFRLLELQAFVTMHTMLRARGYVMSDIPSSTFPFHQASSTFMGAWAQLLPKSDIWMLLELGAPVYILHEYLDGIDYGKDVIDARRPNAITNFITNHYLKELNAHPVTCFPYNKPPESEPLPVQWCREWEGPSKRPADKSIRKLAASFLYDMSGEANRKFQAWKQEVSGLLRVF